jgi:hypothetical protein
MRNTPSRMSKLLSIKEKELGYGESRAVSSQLVKGVETANYASQNSGCG